MTAIYVCLVGYGAVLVYLLCRLWKTDGKLALVKVNQSQHVTLTKTMAISLNKAGIDTGITIRETDNAPAS